jgi:hypothetical protein
MRQLSAWIRNGLLPLDTVVAIAPDPISVREDTGRSPHHMFTGLKEPWKLEDVIVFGSPTFVIDKCLQDGDSLPKLKDHSCLEIYVGSSLAHADNVPVE